MKRLITGAAALAATAGVLAVAAPASAASYTCTGGTIGSGNYSNITVMGQCTVAPNAMISVSGNINVAPGALLDGQESPATIAVGHNITIGAGALVELGCQPENTIGAQAGVPCATDPTGHTTITVGHNVTATNAAAVILRALRIGGNVTAIGGGDGETPWAIKGNTIGGNVTVRNITPEFFLLGFNRIGGTVTLQSIHETDTDPDPFVGVVQNVIGRNLNCTDLLPRAGGGFVPGAVNVVGGRAAGQCAALV
jgi:hypothetical protein